jgi:hypothetical protein
MAGDLIVRVKIKAMLGLRRKGNYGGRAAFV